ncbi:hypothetical protein FJT64_011177 [Amphibalanus amphitrite]|uniref:Uncharacterized protein n=1 Tax=Amphibalanus amphitrite TaxID=1232801 RepID=A0A6A4VBY7_AMPAM|nr:hypothetical protein FJT64_011177 [Amphibalanus amphitrite]
MGRSQWCAEAPQAASTVSVGIDAGMPSAAVSEESTSAEPLEERRPKMELEPELEDVCPTGSAVSLSRRSHACGREERRGRSQGRWPPVLGPMASCGRTETRNDGRKQANVRLVV